MLIDVNIKLKRDIQSNLEIKLILEVIDLYLLLKMWLKILVKI